MSDSKPCPALERNQGLIEACATCPNRKPVSLEELVKRVDAKYKHDAADYLYDCGIYDVLEIIKAYEKELNNG